MQLLRKHVRTLFGSSVVTSIAWQAPRSRCKVFTDDETVTVFLEQEDGICEMWKISFNHRSVYNTQFSLLEGNNLSSRVQRMILKTMVNDTWEDGDGGSCRNRTARHAVSHVQSAVADASLTMFPDWRNSPPFHVPLPLIPLSSRGEYGQTIPRQSSSPQEWCNIYTNPMPSVHKETSFETPQD